MASVKRYGNYDAVISGGGLAGLACALALASGGQRVAIVERRSALGWEITRARRVFFAEGKAEQNSGLLAALCRELGQYGRISDGAADAAYVEMILEQWAEGAGIDILYHGIPVRVENSGNGVYGLVAATVEGYQLLEAGVVVEADDAGRLVPEQWKQSLAGEATYVWCASHARRAYILAGVELEAGRSAVKLVLDGRGALLRSLGNGKAQLDVEVRSTAGNSGLRERLSVLEAMEVMRRLGTLESLGSTSPESPAIPAGLEQARLIYEADEAWALPSFKLVAPEQAACHGGIKALHDGKLLLAGSWLRGPWPEGPWLESKGLAGEYEELARRCAMGEAAAIAVQWAHQHQAGTGHEAGPAQPEKGRGAE